MCIVFLDMDGVVNDATFFRRRPPRGEDCWDPPDPLDMINPENVARLNVLLERTNAKVVISSSWRVSYTHEQVAGFLAHHGFVGEVIGATPVLKHGVRGHEIHRWIERHPEVQAFVILDDNADMAHLLLRLVQTSWHDGGLLDAHVERAVALLREDAS